MGSVNENVNIRIREDGSRVVAKNIRGVGDAANDAEEGLLNMKTVLLGLISGATLASIAHMADEFTNIQNRLRLVTTGQANLARVTAELGNIANETRNDFSSTAEMYSRMALSSKELGIGQKDLLAFTKSLNQAIILSGASAEEAAGGIRQLSQGMASGTLRGDELNSVLENLPMVADVIAKGLGVTRGELRKMGQEGKLTAIDIINAFKEAEDELDKGFGTTVPTLGQSLTVLKNNFMLFIGEVDKSYGITAGLSKIILSISNNLETIVPIIVGVGVAIATAFAPAVIMAFAAQVQALWALMLANPFVAVAALVAGVVTSLYLMRDAIKIGIDDTTTLGDLMRALWADVSQWIMDTAETARGLWYLLTSGSKDAGDAVAKNMKNSTDASNTAFTDFFQDTGTGLAGLMRGAARTMDAIAGFIAGMVIFGKKAIGQMIDFIVDQFKRAANAAADFAESYINHMIDASNTMRTAVGLDPLEHVNFPRAEREGADKFKDIGALWAESMDEGFNLTIGQPGTGGLLEGAVNDLLKKAQDIGKARIAAEGALGDLNGGGGGTPPKPPIDEDALKKAAKALEQLKQALRGVMDEASPMDAATRRLAEAHDILARAVQAHLITQEKAAAIYEQLKFQMRDQIDPLGALNRAIDENIELLKMGNRERQIEGELRNSLKDLQMQGKTLTEEETAALRAKLQVEQELQRISQARDQFDQSGSLQQMQDFKDQLNGLLESIKGGGTGEGDMANALSSMLPWADLSNTQEQMAAYVQAHADMYSQIKALEDAQVISHQTAQMLMAQADVKFMEQRLQSQRSFFSTLAGLSSSSNKRLAAIGKAAAITTAVIDGVVAIQKAWASAPYPANLPAVAATTVAQAANVAAITSQQVGGFRTGGEFTVGGSGGPDSQTVAFRATPGERVRINTPSQDRALRSSGDAPAPVVKQKIVNVSSATDIVNEALSLEEGEELIWNIIGSQPERLRALTGG